MGMGIYLWEWEWIPIVAFHSVIMNLFSNTWTGKAQLLYFLPWPDLHRSMSLVYLVQGTERSELLSILIRRSRRTMTSYSSGYNNKSLLPKLFAVVSRLLCTPASYAGSEKVFMDAFSTYLSPSSVNGLLFLHSNIQWEMNYVSQLMIFGYLWVV